MSGRIYIYTVIILFSLYFYFADDVQRLITVRSTLIQRRDVESALI